VSVQVQPNQENFNAGEFGERMAARTQFEKYASAGSLMENLLPLPQGGFASRPGTRYVTAAKSVSVSPWLISFIYSTTQSYILELGETAMRFFRNQGRIVAQDTGASITNGTFDTNTSGWTAGAGSLSSVSSRLQISASGGKARQSITTSTTNVEHVIRFEVHGDPGDKVFVSVGSTAGGVDYHSAELRKVGYHTIAFTPTASPFHLEFHNKDAKVIQVDNVEILDNVPIELPTPWTASQLPVLSHVQSADKVWFAVGGSTRVWRLDRFGHAAWSLTEVLFADGPWRDKNDTTTTLAAASTTGNAITITASAILGINDDNGFRATDVGRLMRIKSGSNWGWGQIVGFTDTTHVTVDIKAEAFPTSGTTDWRLGEFNDTDGWPAVVSFVQQRMALAAISIDPQKFWLSVSGDIENFADEDKEADVLDTSSIAFRIATREVNTIFWIAARKKPIIGTQGGNFTLRAEGAVLKPSDIAADFEVSAGCAQLPPLEIGARLVFAQRQARKIVEFADVIQSNGLEGFDAFDLTLLNDRVLKDGVVQMAYQQEPDSVIWCVRGDGQLASLTYMPDQDVIGWSRHIVGGSFEGGDAVVESVAVIPGQNSAGQFKDSTGRHEVWVAVKRTVNGAVTRSIEVLEKLFNGQEDLQEEAYYVDSGVSLDSPVTITGITQANPAVVTAAGHGFSNGDDIRIVRVKGMTQVNNTSFKVASVATNTFELQDLDSADVDSSAFTAYAAGGEVRKKVSSVTGLSHLEGETVQIFADGAVQANKTVSSGAITLDTAASVIHAGLGYTRQYRTLKLAFGARDGSAVGRPKSIADIILILLETAEGALSFAAIEDGITGAVSELDLRQADNIDGDPVNLFTGEHRTGITAGFDEDVRLLLTGSTPTPSTVLAVSYELETSS